MKFRDMKYERVDAKKLGAELDALTARLEGAKNFAEADAAFAEAEKLGDHVSTMWTLCYIRHSIDTRDEFYDRENDAADNAKPVFEEHAQRWSRALSVSRFRPEFEQKYGSLMFRNIELQLKCFSPEIIPDLQEENRLQSEYGKLLASAQIDFRGEKRTLSQMTPFKESPDDALRAAAWRAEAEFYAKNGEKLDSIFDSLVKVRSAMAAKLGCRDFTELAYCRMTRNSYDRADVEKFRAEVRRSIVPLAAETYKIQAERMGKRYPMGYADNALAFKSGNARPVGTPEQILAHGKKFYTELSPETAEFIGFMYENELLDVLSKEGKAQGGFCDSLPEYGAEFIFANFNGTSGDVEVITHEAGHAFASYLCRGISPAECRFPTMESCEIHSMSMEFFAWPWAEGFFGKDTAKFRYSHLASAARFIPYGTLVDHFQHVMYERPELTPAERHGVWKELAAEYLPWVREEELPFYSEGRAWQRQLHIYEVPFYYIDYCLAQTVALQFWALMQKDVPDAWARYLRLVRLGGTRTFTELVAAAGLESPFKAGALDAAASAAREYLEKAAGEIEAQRL